MSGWRNQLNNVGSNAFDFVQRISNELAAETPLDPSSELDYHKQKALEKEKELVRYQSQLTERNREIEELNESVKAAYEEVELTRQSLLNRIAAKELELEKAKYEIEALRDFQTNTDTDPDQERNEKELILELELIRAEKAALSDELSFLSKKLEDYEANEREKAVKDSNVDAKLNKTVKELEEARQKILKLEKEKAGLIDEFEKRPRSASPPKSRVNIAELEEIENQVSLLQEERDKFQRQYEQEQVKTKELEQLMGSLVEECSKLSKNLDLYNTKVGQVVVVERPEVPAVDWDVDTEDMDNLRAELGRLEEERHRTVQELEEIKTMAGEKEAHYNAKIQELNSVLSQQQEAYAATANTISVALKGNQVTFDDKSILKLMDDMETMNLELESLKEQYEVSMLTLEKNKRLYDDVSQLCKVLSGESNVIQDISDDSVVQLQNLIEKEKFKSADLETRLQNAEGLLNQQKQDFENIAAGLKQQLEQLNFAFSENREKLRESESLIETLRNEKEEQEKHKNDSEATQAQSEESNELQKIIEKERFKSAELEMRLKSTEGLLNQQKKNFESITTELEQQLDQVNMAFSENRDKLRESESLIQTLRSEKEEMEKYKDGSDAAQVQSEESNEQQKIIENERFKSAELEMRLKSAEGLLNQQKKNFESITTELEQQLDQVNLAFSESRDKLRESESLIQTLRNEKEELEKQKSEPVNLPTTDEPNQLQSQRINELEHLIRNMENEHSNDKTKLDQLEKKGLESYMLIRDLSERLREEHGIEVEGTDSDDVNYKIRNLVFSCKGLIVTLNEKIRYQENQFIELQNNMVDVKQKMEQNSNQLLHLHEENQYLRSQFNIAQDSVEELTAAKNSLQDELKKAKDDLRTIISERKNLEENTVEAELFKLHATSKIEKKQAELEEQVALLEKQKSDMEQNKKMMDQWVGENEMLKKTMIGLNETIRDLQSAYVETDGKLKLERMEYDNKIRELERKLNVNEAEAAKYREAMKELEEKNSQLENTVADLKMELEEFEKGNANPPPPPEPTVEIKQQYKMIESGFAVPPVVRQFIISAITCDANKREESSLLLANIIGCTQEEKNQIEECFQNRGLWGLLRGSSSKGPQNIKELSSKFIEFLEKETTQPMGVANVDNSEPIRIDHDIQPVATSSNSDLKAIVSEK